MKTIIRVFLFITIALQNNSCQTANVATEKANHEQAVNALEEHNFRISIEEIYTGATNGKKRVLHASECYLDVKDNQVSFYISPDNRNRELPIAKELRKEGVSATLSKGERQKNGNIHYTLKIVGKKMSGTSQLNIILYKATNRCFIRLNKVFHGTDSSARGYILPL